MKYKIIYPPPILLPYVKYFWTVEIDPASIATYQMRTLVDDSSGMIFQIRVNSSAIKSNGLVIPQSFLYGQTIQPTINECICPFSCIGVLFHPYALHQLFRLNSSAITNKMINWLDISEEKELADRILNSNTIEEGINHLSNFLIGIVNKRNIRFAQSKYFITYIQENKGQINVNKLLANHNISERTLERLFINEIGVTVKHYIQVTKFQEILKRFELQNNDRLIDIAYDLAFTDQSHFNNMVRKYSQCTPKKLKDSIVKENRIVNVFLS